MKNQLNKSIQTLKEAKTLLYPTDTVWGIGCDATNSLAVDKIYKIKKRDHSKSMIILVDGIDMLEKYIEQLPTKIVTYLKTEKQPVTVIYLNPKNLAKNLIAKNNTIAIRIVKTGFVYELIKLFGKPIISTSANASGYNTPLNFNEIDKTILEKVDYTVKVKLEIVSKKASKIIKFINNEVVILRD